MQLVAIIGQDLFSSALRRASDIGRGVPLPAGLLHAPLDDDTKTWIERIWSTVLGALQHAYREGIGAAQPLVYKAAEQFSELSATLKGRVDDVRAAIAERLNAFLRDMVEGALARVQSVIKVGGREIAMTGVTIEQKIKVTGSLKASLEEICSFVAEGEMTLSATYGSAD